MTIRHLRIFLAVCDSGSMTEAAERLFMSQPSGEPGGAGRLRNTMGCGCLTGFPRSCF